MLLLILILVIFVIPIAAVFLTKEDAYTGPTTQMTSLFGMIAGFVSIPLWLIIPIPLFSFTMSLSGLIIWKRNSTGARNLVMSVIGLLGSGVGLYVFFGLFLTGKLYE